MTIVTKTTSFTLSLTQEQADILANLLIKTVLWSHNGVTGQFANTLYGDLVDAGAQIEHAPELFYSEEDEHFKEVE